MESCINIKERIQELEKELELLKNEVSSSDPLVNLRETRNKVLCEELNLGVGTRSMISSAITNLIRTTIGYKDIRFVCKEDIWELIFDMQKELLPIVCKYYKQQSAVKEREIEALLSSFKFALDKYKRLSGCNTNESIKAHREVIDLANRLCDMGYSKEELRMLFL